MNYKIGNLEIDEETRSRHLYITGKTGAGKTNLIKDLALQDIRAGNGLCVIDFHSDLIHDIADSIPEDRINDTILFQPTDPTHICTIDPFKHTDVLQRTALVGHIISIFKARWADAWGPSTNWILTNTLHLLLASQQTKLTDIPRVLTDSDFRNTLLRNCEDEHIKRFWQNIYANWNSRLRDEKISPLLNKSTVFTNPILEPILSRPATLDIREIIDTKKVLLCDFSKALMGQDNAEMLSSLVTTMFYQAALSRHNIPPEDRHLYNLIVDEFQNAVCDTFDGILSEARKYKLGLTIAHQHSEQLPRKILSSAFANASTKIVFRVSGIDANMLALETGAHPGNLTGTAKYHARVSIDGGKDDDVELPPPTPNKGTYQRVLDRTHGRYSLAR